VTRALAARCLALLGPFDGALAIVGPGAPELRAALPDGVASGAVERPAAALVSFLGAPAVPAARQALLAELRGRLPPGAPLLVVDHNQPRRWWRRGVGAVALLTRRLPPARARYPAAREMAALGLEIERLRLARGERIQLVAARRRSCGGGRECVQEPQR
jgi:hypothetical protein